MRDNSSDITVKDIHFKDLQQNHEHEDSDDSEFDCIHNGTQPRGLAARPGDSDMI